ncbi:hypothetical protein [Caulobacter sp. 602-1]|uniref:hypothetical protein n=1 Tax=Caulobacter sp. 602-1 TaxID=2492472 RepID=UPI000F62F26C|nr:hypothetical protein [Caulobacter sp. 602-1]RRN64657.1 hypothetical protein EIK80_11520 [Caulobacter sp. 602-1]
MMPRYAGFAVIGGHPIRVNPQEVQTISVAKPGETTRLLIRGQTDQIYVQGDIDEVQSKLEDAWNYEVPIE